MVLLNPCLYYLLLYSFTACFAASLLHLTALSSLVQQTSSVLYHRDEDEKVAAAVVVLKEKTNQAALLY